MYANILSTWCDWGKKDEDKDLPQSRLLDTTKERLDLLWHIDSKQEMKIHILPIKNIQPLHFKTTPIF